MPTLTVTPNPAPPSTLVAVAGAGFANAKTRLMLDGAGASTNIFRPRKDGTFNVGITVASSPKTQTLVAQQQSGSTWTEKARTTIVVQSVVTPPTVTTVVGPPIAVNAVIAPRPTPVTSIQAAIDAAPAGTTVNIPAGTYRESISITKPLTLVGAGIGQSIIDGRDASGTMVRSTWLSVRANDVTVKGFTMTSAAGTNATGSVENAVGVQRFTLDSCELAYSYVNLNLTGAIDSIIRNCSVHDAKHLGVRVSAPSPTSGRGQRNLLIGNRFYHNARVGEPDPGADAGNLKATGQDGLIMDGNDVYDSGKGLWLDVWCRNSVYRNNRIHHHDGPGIHDETSTGSKIYNNVAWANGFTETWGWGAGILVAACKDTEVYGNTLAWNKTGISFISQNRGDDPGMTGNYSHDNFVAAEQQVAGKERFGEFWAYDYTASIIYLPASNNRGLNDVFYYANPDGSAAPENQYARFIWDGYRTLATFQTTSGGQGASYATQAVAVAKLQAAGLPLTP